MAKLAFPLLLLCGTAALAADPPPIPRAGDAVPVKAAPAPAPKPAPPKPAALTLVIPAEVHPVEGYARVNPKTNAVSVLYVALDAANPFPSDELKDGRRFLLPTQNLKDGRYRFVAVAAGKGGEQVRTQFAVVVGDPPAPPGPGPHPDPTPKPDGTLGLRKASREAALQVPAAARAVEAAKLAGANRSTASAVAAGAAVKDGRFDAQTALDLWRAGNKGAVADPTPWGPWAAAASAGLQAQYKAGKLGATAAGWAAAFNELADGLADAGGN